MSKGPTLRRDSAHRLNAHIQRKSLMPLRLRNRLASPFPLGIAARLTLSFIAVAVLAAAANLIARETVSIIYLPPRAAPAAPPLIIVPRPITHDRLLAAIDTFEQVYRQRSIDSKAGDAVLIRAAEQVRHAVLGSPGLERAANDYLLRAHQSIYVEDQRRAARATYFALTSSLYERLKNSLDGSLQIFGRVLARQSLVRLRNDFDRVRTLSQIITDGELPSGSQREEIAAAEANYLNTFTANQASLDKSEGSEWVWGMRADFAALVAARSALETLTVQTIDAEWLVSQGRGALTAATFAADSSANQPPAAVAPLPLPPDGIASQAADDHAIDAAAVQDANRPAREMMATVTLLVMLLVIAISLATVRSVLGPVRRMLEGSKRLAAGDTDVELARGGIRELDTLAAAFNSMASKLAAAQEASRLHQATLEDKVQERTHKLRRLAEQDPLTSLPNRRHLLSLLHDAIERASRGGLGLWVYFIDLDNFKNFNDSEGHVFGDRVLMSVANRLEEVADGLGFVARLGGDEFTLVCEQAPSPATVHDIGMRIVHSFQKMISVDQRELSISVSVGASIYPEHGTDAEHLLRAADSALFRAKELGRSQVAVFTPELIESAASRFTTEQGLRRALESQQFELLYQPEYNLATLQMDLVEALLRWRMPDGRLARPGEFLGVAEQSGLITEINDWVLHAAIESAARWYHGAWPGVKVAVNISPRQLMDQRFADFLLAMIREHRIPATCIELELTETVLQTGPATITALRHLHAQGFGIALDDFGTGYSSLTSLEQLPLTRIKLDRSLIASIDTSVRSASIARAIIDLCAGLSLEVTAEGIERPQQLAWLLNSPDLTVQGYLLSDALPFDAVMDAHAALSHALDELLLSMPSARQNLKDARRAAGLPVPLKHTR
jgi:diguanylate cyclase (GGDEF)-like protein